MTIEQLIYFSTVSKNLNLTRSAEMLYISQPTLSRQISLLENELGTPLLYRHPNKKLSLTSAGAALAEHAEDILSRIEAMRAAVLSAASRVSGSFNVATVNFFYPEIYDLYRNFSAQNPDVTLSISRYEEEVFQQITTNDEIDLAVGFSFDLERIKDQSKLDVLSLYAEDFVVVMSNRHPLAGCSELYLRQMAEYPILVLSDVRTPIVDEMMRNAQQVKDNVSSIRLVNSIDSLLLQITSSDSAISMVPRPNSMLIPNGLATAKLIDLDTEFRIVMAWRKGNTSPALGAFLALAREVFSDSPLPSPLTPSFE